MGFKIRNGVQLNQTTAEITSIVTGWGVNERGTIFFDTDKSHMVHWNGSAIVDAKLFTNALTDLINGATQSSDLASVANGSGASLVGVEDVASNFTGTDLETVLAELADIATTGIAADTINQTMMQDDSIGTNELIDGNVTDAKIDSVSASKLTGVVDQSNLPSYVDDVLEYADEASFPGTGEAGKIYIALDTNYTYRWTGSVYVKISDVLSASEVLSLFEGETGRDVSVDGTKLDSIEASATANSAGDGISDTSGVLSVDLTTASGTTLVLSSMDETIYNQTYTTSTVTGTRAMLNTFTDDSNYRVYKYDAGGGTFYCVMYSELTSVWTAFTTSTDPDTLTNGDAIGPSNDDAITSNSDTQDGKNVPDEDHARVSYTGGSNGSNLEFSGGKLKVAAAFKAEVDANTAKISYDATSSYKVDAIEAGATADQTGAEIKASYEAESDTNAFSDAEKSKLGDMFVPTIGNTASRPSHASGVVKMHVDTTLGFLIYSDGSTWYNLSGEAV